MPWGIIACSCAKMKTKTKPERKFSFLVDNACDEETKPLILHYIVCMYVFFTLSRSYKHNLIKDSNGMVIVMVFKR